MNAARLAVMLAAALLTFGNAAACGPGNNGSNQQTKPDESKPAEKPAEKWTSPLQGSKSSAQEQADFEKLVPLYDKAQMARDALNYAVKCGTEAEKDAANKAAIAALEAYNKAVDEYVLGWSNTIAASEAPKLGGPMYREFQHERYLVQTAVEEASKYKSKPIGDCPKKAAEAPPTQTVPGEPAPIHSKATRHKHHCREDEPCSMEGVAIKPQQSAPVSTTGSSEPPDLTPEERERREHRRREREEQEEEENGHDHPAYPSSVPDIPEPPNSSPHD